MISFIKHNNVDAAVINLLTNLKIDIDSGKVVNELEKHPNYPSLLAVSDILTAFNVDNNAFRISFDELQNVPCPFIAHTTMNGDYLMVVTHKQGNNFFLASEKWNNRNLSAEEFKKIFSGIVLTAESMKQFTNSTTNTVSLERIKTPLIIAGLFLILMLGLIVHYDYFTRLSWQTFFLTIFKSAGLVTSILLLVQSIDNNNPLVKSLCKAGGKTDCNAILSSRAAKVFGSDWFTWSEVGFIYFAATWLLLLFGGSSETISTVLALLNFSSLPYTVYSIYYQVRVAKQWCIFCCTIQALLWLEFIPLTSYHLSFSFRDKVSLCASMLCFLIPIILWAILKPLIIKLQQVPILKQQLRKFKYNNEVFNYILKDQPKHRIPSEDWSIVLGNAEASNIVTMVTNPYCTPCAEMHNILEELLEQNPSLQARIVFAGNNTEDDVKSQVTRHLMALNDLGDKAKVKRALHDWYKQKQKNYDAWATLYPIKLKKESLYKLDNQKSWCKIAGVTATPTMLLNDYRLPDVYQLSDLKYMLQ